MGPSHPELRSCLELSMTPEFEQFAPLVRISRTPCPRPRGPFVRRETFVAQSCPSAFEPLASLTVYRAPCVFRGRPSWERLPAVLDVSLWSRSPTFSSIPLMPPWLGWCERISGAAWFHMLAKQCIWYQLLPPCCSAKD